MATSTVFSKRATAKVPLNEYTQSVVIDSLVKILTTAFRLKERTSDCGTESEIQQAIHFITDKMQKPIEVALCGLKNTVSESARQSSSIGFRLGL
jgi:hypothetical protein